MSPATAVAPASRFASPSSPILVPVPDLSSAASLPPQPSSPRLSSLLHSRIHTVHSTTPPSRSSHPIHSPPPSSNSSPPEHPIVAAAHQSLNALQIPPNGLLHNVTAATNSSSAPAPTGAHAPGGATAPTTVSPVSSNGSHPAVSIAVVTPAVSAARSSTPSVTPLPVRLPWLLRLPRFMRPSHTNRFLVPIALVTVVLSICLVVFHFFHAPSAALIHHRLMRAVPLLDFHRSWFGLRRSARRLVHNYQRQLHVFPLASRAITAGIIFWFADTTAQLLNRPRKGSITASFSFHRNIRYAGYGLLIMGPLLYVWYDFMNRYGPPDDLRGSLMKAVFEAMTLEPFCVAVYILYDAIVWQRTYQQFNHALRTRLVPLWVRTLVFWFPANFSNYYIGTPDMRVIFSNLCSLFWNVYFSNKVNCYTPYRAPSSSSPSSPSSPLPSSSSQGGDRGGVSSKRTVTAVNSKILPV